jgi:hypothetical protein
MKLIFSSDKAEIQKLAELIESSSFEGDFEIIGEKSCENTRCTALISESFKNIEVGVAGGINLTATGIRDYLFQKFNETFELKHIGVSLKKLGIVKRSVRINTIAVGGYKVLIPDYQQVTDRFNRFTKAQNENLHVKGVFAKDFKHPNEFNLKVSQIK